MHQHLPETFFRATREHRISCFISVFKSLKPEYVLSIARAIAITSTVSYYSHPI